MLPALPAVGGDVTEDGAGAGPDAASAAVLAALDTPARRHPDDVRPAKTRAGYARDRAVWGEYLDWPAAPERTGHRLPDTSVETGTLVGFVVWLDRVAEAAPATIERRITGVTAEARRRGVQVSKETTLAARRALTPIRLDPDRLRAGRGRGRAVASTPAQLRAMSTADPLVPRPVGSRRRRRDYAVPELARLRDRALTLLSFAVAGRASEVSGLDVGGIVPDAEGLHVAVPSVKGRPGRDVVVAYGRHEETCPVRAWLAWRAAAGLDGGPAFRPVDQWGRLGTGRLSPDGCRIVITRTAERAGLETRLTGHSQRAGLITAGIRAGKQPDKVRAQSGHADGSPVFEGYVRDARAREDAATDGIGL
ncbi:tyrosine-type recombinase/integrase [Kitasatospora sp. NPDC058201]|uniref:tyrosine-type recombinase/integrase n=1 Tax=unclassified Kitasatospora TaxID=2633591 RepID=UPI003655186D